MKKNELHSACARPDTVRFAQRVLLPLCALLYLVSALYLMVPFVAGAVGSGYTGLDSSPYGTPARPMVYRVVMPAIARVVRACVPEAVEKPLTERMIAWRDSEEGKRAVKNLFFRPPPLADNQIFESAVAAFVAFASLLAFIAMYYRLVRALFPESLAFALVAPLLMLQVLPALTINNAYIYDFAELFFACALPLLMVQGRWRAYLAVLALATLNKETSLFSIVFFASYYLRRMGFKRYVMLLAAQCALWLAIKGGLTLYFASYPGELIGPPVSLPGNIRAVLRTGDVVYFILLAGCMLYRRRRQPQFLRGSLPMIATHTLVYFAVCIPYEYRDFYWSLPFILLFATHALVSAAGIADHPLFVPRRRSQAR